MFLVYKFLDTVFAVNLEAGIPDIDDVGAHDGVAAVDDVLKAAVALPLLPVAHETFVLFRKHIFNILQWVHSLPQVSPLVLLQGFLK